MMFTLEPTTAARKDADLNKQSWLGHTHMHVASLSIL